MARVIRQDTENVFEDYTLVKSDATPDYWQDLYERAKKQGKVRLGMSECGHPTMNVDNPARGMHWQFVYVID